MYKRQAQNALWGTALVMEVATGDLLAMANLSRTKSGAYAEVKNHALSSRMEPGSTFKLAALLALVDDAGMSLDETFDTGNGARVKVGRTTVQDSHGLPPLNLKDAVAHSSNVFFARAVYETYKDDAVKASKILGITLTKSNGRKDDEGKPLAMAGFPYHALDTYLPKLIRAGERVAICDQLEMPKQTTSSKRGITEMVSPGKETGKQMAQESQETEQHTSLRR